MASIEVSGATILIDTDLLAAEVHTEGYVSGVFRNTLLDKTTGARDLGFGLDIVDFLLEPLADEPGGVDPAHQYHHGDKLHGDIPKRYVELPQICTGAGKLDFEIIEGEGFVGLRQWFRWQEATYGRAAGSLWEQTVVFADGLRYFFCADRVTSVNTVDELILRIDLPGHLKHDGGAEFEQIYLSYQGSIPSAEFVEDFAPDERCLYERDDARLPKRIIRAYQVRLEGSSGSWLAGMTLDPADVYQAWCHQRGYVCFIEEIGGRRVEAGQSFGAAHIIGWFDDIAEAEAAYDEHGGASGLRADGSGYELTAYP